jgi:hypothetical protein
VLRVDSGVEEFKEFKEFKKFKECKECKECRSSGVHEAQPVGDNAERSLTAF